MQQSVRAKVTRKSGINVKRSTGRSDMFGTSVSETTLTPKKLSKLIKSAGLKSPHVLLEDLDINRILKDNQLTPKRPTTKSQKISSAEKKRRKTQIENLHSDLSPKLTEFSPTDGKRSRYGRQQRTPSKLKTVTSPGAIFEQKFVSYQSPIEELIKKNKLLANMAETSPTENSGDTVPDSNREVSRGFGGSPISSSAVSAQNSPKTSPSVGSEPGVGAKGIDSNGNDINASNQMVEYVNGLKDGNNEAILRNMNNSPSANSTDSAKGSSIDSDPEVPPVAGVFWGRVASFPYWPCIVWPDPKGHFVSGGLRQQVRVHVRFFADNGRRSWIRRENMLPYNGLEDFNNRMKETQEKYSKKHRNYKAFVISSSKIALWTIAVSEADDVHAEAVENRFEKFNQILDASRQRAIEAKRKKGIRDSSTRRTSYLLTKDMSSMIPYSGELINDGKRMRSETPDSATYETTQGLELVKRQKFEDIGTIENSKPLEEELRPFGIAQHEDIVENEEFSQFFDVMKTYAMCSNNEDLEKKLYQSVHQIWTIRSLAKRELKDTSFSSVLSAGEMTIRRLSSRMRILSKKDIYSPSTSKLIENKVEKKDYINGRPMSRPLEQVVEDIIGLSKNYLFKGLNREPVCKVCYKPSDLLKCAGLCQQWIHSSCMEEAKSTSKKMKAIVHVTGDTDQLVKDRPAAGSFLCDQCKMGEDQPCFVCKETSSNFGELIRCHINWCGRSFHIACLKYWPQAKLTKSSTKVESLLCPCHVCHTCVSDDPRGKFLQIDRQKLTKCVECPATYHLESSCIPAGTRFLTATNIICPRHRQGGRGPKCSVNANWCFICTQGGTLMCCETCPTAFHIECLKLPQPEEGYICEECETGRMPLYGEMVWAKLGSYRWWPAIIIPPPEVPKNLLHKKHNESDFCVRFFGSNDYTWISRRRVFLYQEGDWGRVSSSKNLDQVYKSALEDARKTADLIKAKKMSANKIKEKFLAPPPYIKIKVNKAVPPVKLQEVDISELTACDCNPSDENPCGSGCLNRLLQSECNPKICPAGDKCQNQMFEKRLYPPLKLTFTGSKGWGLFCDEEIAAGAFIIEYVGEVIDDAEFKRRIAQKQEEKDENYYFLTLENNYMIDAGPKGNLARFMNHSCEPNCTTQKWNVNGVTRVGLFAIHDIKPNTELTFNYNLECIGDKKVCHCGAEKCAGFIGAKYKEPEQVTLKKRLKTRKYRKLSKDTPVVPKN